MQARRPALRSHSHALQERTETGVGLEGSERRVDLQVDEVRGTVVDRLLETVERLVFLAEGDLDPSNPKRLYVGLLRALLEIVEQLLCLGFFVRGGESVGLGSELVVIAAGEIKSFLEFRLRLRGGVLLSVGTGEQTVSGDEILVERQRLLAQVDGLRPLVRVVGALGEREIYGGEHRGGFDGAVELRSGLVEAA